MAKRPFFIPTRNKEELVKTHSVKFTWSSGFAKSQKQKSILSFHKSISKEFKLNKILDNDKEYDIGELKNLIPSKKIKNYQQKLI